MRLTQLELSNKLNINNSVLSRIEAGKRAVEDNELIKFADFFNVDSDYLLGRKDNPIPKLSLGTQKFLEVIELSDEEAIQKLQSMLVHDGKEIPVETIKEILSYARYKVNE
jgi:transcriptional regulator with XRE-family HTH domain